MRIRSSGPTIVPCGSSGIFVTDIKTNSTISLACLLKRVNYYEVRIIFLSATEYHFDADYNLRRVDVVVVVVVIILKSG